MYLLKRKHYEDIVNKSNQNLILFGVMLTGYDNRFIGDAVFGGDAFLVDFNILL